VDLEPLAEYLLANRDEPRAVKLAGLQVLALDGIVRGKKGRAWLLAQLDDSDPEVRLAAVKAAERAHLK
jgi:hypothetical protein